METEKSNTNSQLLKISLSTPVDFEGETVSEIDLSGMENWNCEDLIKVKKEFEGMMGTDITPSSVMLPESNLEYCSIVAAEATGKPVELFKVLKAKDALKVRTAVINFFLSEE